MSMMNTIGSFAKGYVMGYVAVKAVRAMADKAQETANAYAYQQAQQARRENIQEYWRNYGKNCDKDMLYMGWF